ncbi:MAG: T9SS type A sorting domain-containing protein [Bacteroidota bacterium]
MKNFVIVSCALACLAGTALSQVTAVTVNDQVSGATVQQGGIISWKITLPVGGTSQNQIWLDVNANEAIDVGTDKMLFSFQQIDGASSGDGPGDMDGSVNGFITTTLPLGLAPAEWIFEAKHNDVGTTASFTITPIPDPAFTVSGNVGGPGDRSNIVLEAASAEGGDGPGEFWHGITDAMGNYTISIGANPTMSNPWRVRPAGDGQSFGIYVLVPRDTTFSITGHHSNVNFQLVQGTVITGLVTAAVGGAGIPNATPHFHDAFNPQGGGEDQFRGTTDNDGRYAFAVLPGQYFMHFTAYHYLDQWWDHKTGGQPFDTITVVAQDSIKDINGSLTLGGVIAGVVTNWGVGTNANVELYAQGNLEFAYSSTNTDFDGTYDFTVPPGTYYVRFAKGTHEIYYDNALSPGTPIVISGTEVLDNINANFEVGPPPPPPAPEIISIKDVPNDQGKQVVVTWRGNEPSLIEGDGLALGVERFSVWFRWNGVWTFVVEVPARRDSLYSVVAPTFIDSTTTNGMHWSKYQVSSHYTFNYYVVNSAVDSGYSLDNLVPGVPGGVGGTVSGSNFIVRWRAVPDEDIRYYAVYRSTVQDFDVTGTTPHATIADTTYTDVGVIGGTTYYYRITAIDFSGNQSPASDPIGTTIVGVDNLQSLPTQFALHQNFPNPFNPSTQINYDVPSESFVSIILYNALGQEVRTILDARQAPGRHTATFNSNGLASGLYFYKMTAGEHVSIRKMNLVK